MNDMPPEENHEDGYDDRSYGTEEAEARVQGPAIALIVTAALGMLLQLIFLALNLLGAGLGAAQGGEQAMGAMFSGTFAIASAAFGLIGGVVVLLGALKMRKLESHGFALAASIIAMIPCISPCCFLGLPIGIWALVVLLNEDVKQAFKA